MLSIYTAISDGQASVTHGSIDNIDSNFVLTRQAGTISWRVPDWTPMAPPWSVARLPWKRHCGFRPYQDGADAASGRQASALHARVLLSGLCSISLTVCMLSMGHHPYPRHPDEPSSTGSIVARGKCFWSCEQQLSCICC